MSLINSNVVLFHNFLIPTNKQTTLPFLIMVYNDCVHLYVYFRANVQGTLCSHGYCRLLSAITVLSGFGQCKQRGRRKSRDCCRHSGSQWEGSDSGTHFQPTKKCSEQVR